ncbi:MAG: helix-turn-helix transcriptional regulator [Elusimicrobia bacterium]|nr:helix-turn-helix transcriptional regulator [Elusimicrobiota bacterium]
MRFDKLAIPSGVEGQFWLLACPLRPPLRPPQKQLAEKADLRLSFVGQMERGLKIPSLITLQRIADVLGVKAGRLLDEGGPPGKPSNKPYPIERRFADMMAGYSVRGRTALYSAFRQLARRIKRFPGKYGK